VGIGAGAESVVRKERQNQNLLIEEKPLLSRICG
jgi:hypothetical protein